MSLLQSDSQGSLWVMGDISGIRDYLFDVAESGGGQAKRLRARSFRIQTLADAAAARILDVLQWTWNQVVFSNASKFLLAGPSRQDQDEALRRLQEEIEAWILTRLRGELRFSMAWVDAGAFLPQAPVAERYEAMLRGLQAAKMRPWANAAQTDALWRTERLTLSPLDTPCDLCRRAPATEQDHEDGVTRHVCRWCRADHEIGRELPAARWFVMTREVAGAGMELLDYGVTLVHKGPLPVESVAVADLREPSRCPAGVPEDRVIRRRLARHIPTDEDGAPVLFAELASQSRGDRLLGAMKADVDDLGVAVHRFLQAGGDLGTLGVFSEELDEFFAGRVAEEMRLEPWKAIYTIFAGGDDLLLVGPWNVIIDFAGHIQRAFANTVGKERGLTLSAGVSFSKPKTPIKFAAGQAEALLDQAKTEAAPRATAPKDQCAAWGYLWKWSDHQAIFQTAKQITDWIDSGICVRGWVQHLLRLGEARAAGDPRATGRLAYFTARNLPAANDGSTERAALRRWADRLLEDFDALNLIDTRYLGLICRYALTATRSPRSSE